MQEVLSTKVNREKIDFCTPNALKAPFSMKQRAQNGVILTGRLVAGRGIAAVWAWASGFRVPRLDGGTRW